ncbi:winged helix-turn-helix domain-containing protein [Sphingomonas sp. AP4-R1]|uniref:winged helix-turn-helix domain-containing protein n=1 Tax=Sphingomonas sp. AP4-R1 TaxID=2735134 RepID=UPI00149380F8|nr:helix-turn-helix domain-containing protein [Sphingomonas sp. AP4-R1]QJU58542.1 winged helix-turn-helix domain-containing protein [Sphingomonas sp. AP4-R1]
MATVVNEGRGTQYGDLLLDEECLFAMRDGTKVHFTRNERAILLTLSGSPNRLLTRSRLLDEVTEDEDRSDRYIDFLVNRLRSKLGDDRKSPTFIHTRYGEGYVWVATPTPAQVVDAVLAVTTQFRSDGRSVSRDASTLIPRLHEAIGAGMAPEKAIFVGEDWHPGTEDKVRHLLHLNLQADQDAASCLVTLREMPSRRIVASFPLDLDPGDASNVAADAEKISGSALAALRRALRDASTALGLTPGGPTDDHRQEASIVLLGANPRWAGGTDLASERARDPRNPDLAFQWCFHLFSRLTIASPFESVGLGERRRIEREIEATVLEFLPAAEDNPLHMFAAAKLLYFLDRGHLGLAEDLAERALARTGDPTGSFALMGQLRCARGRFDEAVRFFDQGIARDHGRDFQLHIRAMKCVALLAAGRRAALDIALAQVDLSPPVPSHIALMMRWTFLPHDRPLPAASANALADIGPTGAANAIEYSWFTSARQIVHSEARANVVRGLIAHAVGIHGEQAVPDVVARAIGLSAAV